MRSLSFALVFLTMTCNTAFADTQVNVVGLFTNKALLVINHGKPVTLSVGQTSP
jgi:aspartyl protease family protein